MAQRRMFSPDITESDAFLEMPASAHSLYFHLGMYADDDGFVNPRKIMRMLGSSEDDLKVLLSKRFLLTFASGVVVVKHWKINNLVRKDWYRPTQYVEEKSLLLIKENGAYTDDLEHGGHFVNESLTQVRLGKDRLEIPANADSSSEEEYEPEEGAKVPKPPKDPMLQKAVSYWNAKCRSEVGVESSSTTPKAMAIIKSARKSLSYTQIREKMDKWFDEETLEDHEMIQITRCLSAFQIDKYLSENV